MLGTPKFPAGTPLPISPQTLKSYPEIFPLSALIARNVMNSPGGAALSFSPRFHH